MVLSYIISKKAFLLFQKMKISSSKFRKFQDGTFVARKAKKTHSEKSSYISENGKLKNSYFFLKKFIIFQEGTCKAPKTKIPLFWEMEFSSPQIKKPSCLF